MENIVWIPLLYLYYDKIKLLSGSNAIFRLVPKTMAAGDSDIFGAVGRNTRFLYFVAATAGIGFAAGEH